MQTRFITSVIINGLSGSWIARLPCIQQGLIWFSQGLSQRKGSLKTRRLIASTSDDYRAELLGLK
ncbi:hypothetical protein E0E54_18305 [Azotobacter chroococcum]|uniref:hypothetical protein n=1 Tax=Azotobacter chroococcum TaxID=353 RepID=UPI001038B1FF|nr:hypothetical protein [Azotobacter chroococcum]TBW32778.1 hypothetical protein E0E54_18305 [Azotobacter chroococcum]